MKSGVLKSVTVLVGATTLAGCGLSIREHRGYVMDEQLTSGIQVGTDNKASVERTLGRPSFTGTFEQNDWYYVSRDTRAFAFRNPRVTDQTVLHVRFDANGNVERVDRTGLELARNIEPSGDETPTLGRNRSIFEEIFGNIGAVGQSGQRGQTADNPQ